MFAAIQRASKSTEEFLRSSALGWVTTSPAPSDNAHQNESPERSPLPSIPTLDLHAKAQDSQWTEIPLSVSDDDEQPSPRGVLQFRKESESDGGYSQADDLMPYPSGTSAITFGETSIRRRRHSSSSTHSSDQRSTGSLSVPTLPLSFASHSWEWDDQWKNHIKSANTTPRKNQGFRNDLRRGKGQSYSLALSSLSGLHGGDFGMEGFSPIKHTSSTRDTSIMSARSHNAGTQTPKGCDDFASTRTALQHQLADALSALDLTRKQADALRDRLRTYTSSMKQQADDLRASSRSLSNALDKAKEYKTQWKNESTLKAEAKRKVEELDLNMKSLQYTLNQRESEVKMFHQGVDTLNTLLGVDIVDSREAKDKLMSTTKAIRQLLDLVEKLQSEATVSSLVSKVELQESLRNFEKEKASWISFTKSKEKAVTSKIAVLARDNEMLQAKLDRVQQSSVEIRNQLSQANIGCADKAAELNRSQKVISTMQTAIRTTKEKLAKSMKELELEISEKNELRTAFAQKESVLEEEKRAIELNCANLKILLEKKEMEVREQINSHVLLTDLRANQSQHCDVAIQTAYPDSQPFEIAVETEREEADALSKSLQQEIADLKCSLQMMKRDFFDREDDYLRMRADFRQLRWTCHHQEVTIQTVRAENRALRISISKLKQAEEDPEYESTNDENPGLHAESESGSEYERLPLQTTPESCHEKCPLPAQNVSVSSVGSDEVLTRSISNIQSAMSKSVSSEAEVEQNHDHISRNLFDTNPIENVTHNAAILLSPDNHEMVLNDGDKSKASSKRKRRRKLRRHEFPIWRQENPDNRFSSEKGFEDSSSSDSDHVSLHADTQSSQSTFSSNSLSSKKAMRDSVSSNVQPQNVRRIGVPMSEKEFDKLVRSMNAVCQSPGNEGISDVSLYDDGYSSPVADVLESPRPSSRQLHNSTLLGYEIDSLSSEVDEPTNAGSERGIAKSCFVTYGGLTFDASNFGLVEMRQFMCDLGIAHSETEMHKFIDFLAEKVHELDNDPAWRGSHNLGKSEDWLGLKCIF